MVGLWDTIGEGKAERSFVWSENYRRLIEHNEHHIETFLVLFI
jgi:hypothetical protein